MLFTVQSLFFCLLCIGFKTTTVMGSKNVYISSGQCNDVAGRFDTSNML